MPLDSLLIYTFLLIFVRAGAMFITAPIFNGLGVPVTVRIGLSAVIGMALAPVIRGHVGEVPPDLLTFIGTFIREAIIGLMMGYLVMLVMIAVEMAGSFLDVQMGFSMITILNPQTSTPTSLLSGFKMHLAVILFLILNGHHLLLNALARSYELTPGFGLQAAHHASEMFAVILGQTLMLAVQIAAPIGATMIVADVAMAALSRAVPQMNVLIVAAPAKVIIGLMGLSVALPVFAWSVAYSIDAMSRQLMQLFRGFN